jgi:hypothetical protein
LAESLSEVVASGSCFLLPLEEVCVSLAGFSFTLLLCFPGGSVAFV